MPHVIVKLWPGKAPDEAKDVGPERYLEAKKGQSEVKRLTDVSEPTISVYAPKDKANGAAVLVAPGGGYSILAIEHEGTDTCEWYDGHFSVVCRSEGTGPWGPTKSIGILGYSTEEKVYTYYGVDNSPMTMSTVPKGTVQGKTWSYTDESMMGGKKVKSRVTINEVSPTEYTFKYELQGADGKWAPMMESKSTKM